MRTILPIAGQRLVVRATMRLIAADKRSVAAMTDQLATLHDRLRAEVG